MREEKVLAANLAILTDALESPVCCADTLGDWGLLDTFTHFYTNYGKTIKHN